MIISSSTQLNREMRLASSTTHVMWVAFMQSRFVFIHVPVYLQPNCFSKVVDILGHKHIIIFALRRILQGEELTYDYKFQIEEDKIPCTCGSRKCRKFLNWYSKSLNNGKFFISHNYLVSINKHQVFLNFKEMCFYMLKISSKITTQRFILWNVLFYKLIFFCIVLLSVFANGFIWSGTRWYDGIFLAILPLISNYFFNRQINADCITSFVFFCWVKCFYG